MTANFSIRKCLFPVAGYGTRFLPATKAMPKEMLPIVSGQDPSPQSALHRRPPAGTPPPGPSK